MHCKDDIGKVVKSHGDTITSYAGYSKRNFKKCHSTPLGRFSVKFFLSRITISERRRLGSWRSTLTRDCASEEEQVEWNQRERNELVRRLPSYRGLLRRSRNNNTNGRI